MKKNMKKNRGILPKEKDCNDGSEFLIFLGILVLSAVSVFAFTWLIAHELMNIALLIN